MSCTYVDGDAYPSPDPVDAAQEPVGAPCGAYPASSAVCGVCGALVARCDAHGGVLGMFRAMSEHLRSHEPSPTPEGGVS